MKEIDKILMGVIFTVGGAFAIAIIYVCKKNVCKKTDDLDVVSAMDITYNDIYRKI
jgi:hypothetical protein